MKETKIRNYTGASCWQTWRVGDLCLIRSLSWNEFIWILWKILKNNRGKLQKLTTMRMHMVENFEKKKNDHARCTVEN